MTRHRTPRFPTTALAAAILLGSAAPVAPLIAAQQDVPEGYVQILACECAARRLRRLNESAAGGGGRFSSVHRIATSFGKSSTVSRRSHRRTESNESSMLTRLSTL